MAFPTIPTVGAGRVLFQLATSPSGTHTSPSLSSLTKNSGDLLIAIVIIYDGNSSNAEFSSWGGSFTEFADQAGTTTMGIGAAYKWSTGSETGTFTVTSADTSTNDSCFILLSIAGAHASTPPEAGTMAVGTAPDSGSLNPAGWGTEDTLWISVGASGEDSTSGTYTGIGTAPTNYGNQADSGISADAVGGVEGSVAFRQLNAASEDPGTWSMDTSNARGASLLIAVRPAPEVHSGDGAITVPAATVSGVGVMHPSGTGAIAVPAATVSGTGAEVFTATGAVTVPAATMAGTGAEVFTATGAVTVPAATISGAGAEVFTATGAIVGQAPTVAGTGDHTEGSVNPDGTGAIAVPSATVSGVGELILTGTGAILVPGATVAGVGVEILTATGAITVPAAAVSGSGETIFEVEPGIAGSVIGSNLVSEAASGAEVDYKAAVGGEAVGKNATGAEGGG